MSDAFDFFLAHLVRDFFNHRGLVDLIGDFVDHNRVAVFANFFDAGFGANDDAATPL